MIRFTYSYLRPVALFLAITFIFQCCKVYDKRPVTIEQAINKDHKKAKRIKIKMVGGEKLILDSIYYKKSRLYGSLIRPKEKTKVWVKDDLHPDGHYVKKTITYEIKIDDDKIIKIILQDTKKSRAYTSFTIIGPCILVGIGVFGLGLYGLSQFRWE